MKPYILFLSLSFLGVNAVYPQVTLNTTPSRSVGTATAIPESTNPANPNLIEGRELYSPEGIALDSSVSPPILYVSDTRNNRVLGWKNALNFNNGQPADLVIGQQDFYATDAQGPGQKFSVGLNSPTGLAVNSTGDLYIVDTNNNRILRYRSPFQHVSSTPAALTTAPDLYIGQPSLNSRTANFTGQVSAQGISVAGYPANLAFDASGNLWVCDVFNYRVLRFPVSSLNATGGGISADIVIGQQSLTTTQPLLPASGIQTTNQFFTLGGIGFDPQGRLYVGDSPTSGLGRVLVFANPTAVTNNASADRLMGVFPPNTTTPTQTTLGVTAFNNPASIFFIPDGSGNAYVGIVDPNFNRATVFPPYSQWPAAPAPPQAVQPGGVIGQNLNFIATGPNGTTSTTISTPPTSSSVLYSPFAAVFLASTKELFIADGNNNRVVVMPLQPGSTSPIFFGNATRVLGQARFDQSSINYIEGKEFQFSFTSGSATTIDAGIALDTAGTTPHLYVADPYNHRILGFKDARKIAPNLHADIVIGQPDFGTALCNYPSGDPTRPSQSNLCRPYGLAVDAQGNLYVADSGNGRVLRFPAPFSYTGGGMQKADLVLGQQDFVTQVLDPTQSTMRTPYGLAISGTNGLLVSDLSFNRVLFFKFTGNGTFTAGTDNGKAATKVYGQPDFFGTSSGNSNTQLFAPHQIGADTSGRPYVADTGNNRIQIFDDPNAASTPTGGDPAPLSLTVGINSPRGVYVNPTTGEVWVANTNQGAVVRYPAYDTLILNQTSLTTISDTSSDPGLNSLIQFAPLATVQDQFGDLFVADSNNRIITYYQNLQVVNGASFLANSLQPLAPGTIASIFPAKNGSAAQFGSTTASYTDKPQPTVPTTVGDIQVTVNGTPASIFYVSPGQVNFVIPYSSPSSGTAEVDVIQASTGQILGAGLINMNYVSPGIFQCPASVAALRQGCILNEDNTLNSFTNPALRGHVVQIFGTGQGVIPNGPPDGTPAPTTGTPYSAQFNARVILNGIYADGYPLAPGDPPDRSFVQFFGLAPGFLGLWQLNLQIPEGVTPSSVTGNATQLEVVVNGISDTNTQSGFHMSLVIK